MKLQSYGKWILAGMISLGAVSEGALLLGGPVYAQADQQDSHKERAKEFLALTDSGKWNNAQALFGSNLKESISSDVLQQLWTGLLVPFGRIKEARFKEIEDNGVHTNVTFSAEAENGAYNIVIRLDKEGNIDDFLFDPIYPSNVPVPGYDQQNYTEKEIMIGSGKFALPGLLTVPKGKGPFPAVVLVHGSGAHDRDETMYNFKPFRDIAAGLANEGIAVLRYDKRTRVHAVKSAMDPKFSLQEETVLDANLAVERLKSLPEVDKKQIFIFGHSQGAYASPLIVENDKKGDIKGVINAAGPASKFQDLLIWQMKESVARAKEMKAPEDQIQALEKELEFYTKQFKLLEDPKFTETLIPPGFMLQNPYWWFSLRDYKPADLAKTQDVPMLFLQGEKDIQVPLSEYEVLQRELKNVENTEFKSYPNMFHMLADFNGEPNGITEYMKPGNVAQELIHDVAKWIKEGSIGPGKEKQDKEVYWDGLLMKKGQIGKVTIKKPINLWKREGGKLVFARVLAAGVPYRVYRYDEHFGGQYGLGGGYYVTDMEGYIIYQTPSKAKLKELE